MEDNNVETAIVLSYESKIGQDRALRFQTSLPQSCTPNELSAVVDKLRTEADRQDASLTLDLLISQEASELKMLENVRASVKRVSEEYARQWHLAGKKGEFKASSNERKSLENINSDIEVREKRILDIREKQKECEKKLGWLASHQHN